MVIIARPKPVCNCNKDVIGLLARNYISNGKKVKEMVLEGLVKKEDLAAIISCPGCLRALEDRAKAVGVSEKKLQGLVNSELAAKANILKKLVRRYVEQGR